MKKKKKKKRTALQTPHMMPFRNSPTQGFPRLPQASPLAISWASVENKFALNAPSCLKFKGTLGGNLESPASCSAMEASEIGPSLPEPAKSQEEKMKGKKRVASHASNSLALFEKKHGSALWNWVGTSRLPFAIPCPGFAFVFDARDHRASDRPHVRGPPKGAGCVDRSKKPVLSGVRASISLHLKAGEFGGFLLNCPPTKMKPCLLLRTFRCPVKFTAKWSQGGGPTTSSSLFKPPGQTVCPTRKQLSADGTSELAEFAMTGNQIGDRIENNWLLLASSVCLSK